MITPQLRIKEVFDEETLQNKWYWFKWLLESYIYLFLIEMSDPKSPEK